LSWKFKQLFSKRSLIIRDFLVIILFGRKK